MNNPSDDLSEEQSNLSTEELFIEIFASPASREQLKQEARERHAAAESQEPVADNSASTATATNATTRFDRRMFMSCTA